MSIATVIMGEKYQAMPRPSALGKEGHEETRIFFPSYEIELIQETGRARRTYEREGGPASYEFVCTIREWVSDEEVIRQYKEAKAADDRAVTIVRVPEINVALIRYLHEESETRDTPPDRAAYLKEVIAEAVLAIFKAV